MKKVKRRTVAVSLQSESGDDYVYVFRAGPQRFAKLVVERLGFEAGYCHVRALWSPDGEACAEYRAAVNKKVGYEVC